MVVLFVGRAGKRTERFLRPSTSSRSRRVEPGHWGICEGYIDKAAKIQRKVVGVDVIENRPPKGPLQR
jgi:hypothetical protein